MRSRLREIEIARLQGCSPRLRVPAACAVVDEGSVSVSFFGSGTKPVGIGIKI